MSSPKNNSNKRVKHEIVHVAPKMLIVALIIFAVFSLIAGELFNAYEKFWWWDDMLHTVSGIIVGLIGFLMVYFFNARYNMHISPVFVAVFAFSFAIAIGVLWEIFEFTMDVTFKTEMQRWNLSSDAILIGREYQGVGLRDTMSDLIVAWIGAIFASVFAFFAYKNERPTVLGVMKRIFPKRGKKRN